MAIGLDTLAYARRLRDAGVSEQQAEAHAQALAAAMTDSLATKHDLRQLETRIEARFARVDSRFDQLDTRITEQEKRLEIRFSEQSARFDVCLADLERRVTLRLGGIMVAGIGVLSALVTLF